MAMQLIIVYEKKRQKNMLLDASGMSQTNINSVIQISEGWSVIWGWINARMKFWFRFLRWLWHGGPWGENGFYGLFIIKFIVMVIVCTIRPWAPIAPHAAPPQKLHEWYHFVLGTHLIEIPHVTSKIVGTDCVFRPFFKMAASRKWKFQYLGYRSPWTVVDWLCWSI